jgi:hypothetical protein
MALAASGELPAVSQETTSPPIIVVPTPPPAPTAPDSPGNAASLPAAQPALSPYHITGVVIDRVTKSPIPNATLSIRAMNSASRNRRSRSRAQSPADSTTTDADGHFDLSAPSAGGWELTASARGYRAQPLDEHDGYSTAIILTETAPTFDVTFRLTPGSIIEGFILDEAGEAVRGANVALIYLPPPMPENQHRRPISVAQQMTDDRGFYKFATIAPGSYQVRVTATPWYASASPRSGFPSFMRNGTPSSDTPNSGLDPLDVVYPVVWYPGVADPSAATPITLRGGEIQEANFRLLPIPGSHLHIAGNPQAEPADGTHDVRPIYYLTRILPDGNEDPQQSPSRTDGNGNVDIADLSAGTYLVHQQLPGTGMTSLSTIQIGAGSPRTVDFSDGVPAANVTIKVDPAADQDNLQVSFRDLDTGHTTYAQRFQDLGRQMARRRNQAQGGDAPSPDAHAPRPDRTVSLPPGKYEVFLSGTGDVHLAIIEATGATATGRIVTIGSGAPKLFLHTASGRGTVTGIVNFKGQPDPGAMVLLVPATLGDPTGLDEPSRDQSNTDGSFEMTGMLPGGYILIAIDHGWDVNWSDPSTLRRYLMHGVPLEIKPGSDLKQHRSPGPLIQSGVPPALPGRQ